MVPKPYTTLQEELEFRTMEIKTALSMLEKVIVMQHVLGGYGSRTNNVWVSGSEQQRKEIRI